MKNLSENSTEDLLNIIARVITVMLRHLKLPEKEVMEFTGQVKERKMGELFEHFKGYDVPATRRESRAEGRELMLIGQVCKKIMKNKSIVQIAEELEEEESKINSICQVARLFAPEYDEEKILKILKKRWKKGLA